MAKEEAMSLSPDMVEAEDDIDGPRTGKGSIYYIKDRRSDLFKVGLSKDPDRRLKEHKTKTGLDLYIWDEVEVSNMQKAENAVHSAMRRQNFKNPTDPRFGREWYIGNGRSEEAERLFQSVVVVFRLKRD